MEEATPREKLLKRIRAALLQPSQMDSIANVDFESQVFIRSEDPAELNFAQMFSETGGRFFFCSEPIEIADNIEFLLRENPWKGLSCLDKNLQELLVAAEIPFQNKIPEEGDALMCKCQGLIASGGSLIFTSEGETGTQALNQCETLIVIAFTSQLFSTADEFFKQCEAKEKTLPSWISILSNPGGFDHQGNEASLYKKKDVYLFLMDDHLLS